MASVGDVVSASTQFNCAPAAGEQGLQSTHLQAHPGGDGVIGQATARPEGRFLGAAPPGVSCSNGLGRSRGRQGAGSGRSPPRCTAGEGEQPPGEYGQRPDGGADTSPRANAGSAQPLRYVICLQAWARFSSTGTTPIFSSARRRSRLSVKARVHVRVSASTSGTSSIWRGPTAPFITRSLSGPCLRSCATCGIVSRMKEWTSVYSSEGHCTDGRRASINFCRPACFVICQTTMAIRE